MSISLNVRRANNLSDWSSLHQLSDWFTSEDPEHIGVYERDIDDLQANQPLYGFWNGWMWFQCAHSPERAKELADKGYESVYQGTNERQAWRGVLE